jgi:hypothetical protein
MHDTIAMVLRALPAARAGPDARLWPGTAAEPASTIIVFDGSG